MDFKPFSKIPRLSREIVITEKIDGTNGVIGIWNRNELSSEQLDGNKFPYMSVGMDYVILAGSRTKWIDIHSDNAGFGRWVSDNREELIQLGIGYHHGEWWGKKIKRGYNLKEKRFSLFNVSRWTSEFNDKVESNLWNAANEYSTICNEISVCHVVPFLWKGMFETNKINDALESLKNWGSFASKDFMRPEGIVIYHVPSGYLFKKTIEKDESPKGVELYSN